MQNKNAPGTLPEIDEDGFLVDSKKWTKEIAEILAREEIPEGLTEDHWNVIDFMRQHYLEFGSPPPVRMLSRRVGISLRRIHELFPEGLTRGACKYAGLPRIAIKPNYLYP